MRNYDLNAEKNRYMSSISIYLLLNLFEIFNLTSVRMDTAATPKPKKIKLQSPLYRKVKNVRQEGYLNVSPSHFRVEAVSSASHTIDFLDFYKPALDKKVTPSKLKIVNKLVINRGQKVSYANMSPAKFN
jgi:hypothetical protein